MIESQYTAALHKKLPKNIYKWKINDNFAGGVPDAFYRALSTPIGLPLWVEYKFLKKLPERETTVIKPNLSHQQLIWLKQAVNSGEQALVIVGVESEKRSRQTAGFIMMQSEWENGIQTQVARSRLRSMDELATIITEHCEHGTGMHHEMKKVSTRIIRYEP